jgi:hypothetical protein
MLTKQSLRFAALAGLSLLFASSAFAEIIIINAMRQDVRLQFGYADANNSVAWSMTTIPACQAVTVQEDAALRMLHPKFLDERPNPDTGGIDYEYVILDRPGRIGIGESGGRIFLDVSGNATGCPQ